METSIIKEKLVSKIKREYQEIIYRTYPVWKQLNIIRFGGDDLTTMSKFIDNKRVESDVLESKVGALESDTIKNEFSVGTEEEMKSHVDKHLSELNDEQKIMISSALQNL